MLKSKLYINISFTLPFNIGKFTEKNGDWNKALDM